MRAVAFYGLSLAYMALTGCDASAPPLDQALASDPAPVVRLAQDGLYRKEMAFDGVNGTGAEWICIKGGYRAGYDPLEEAIDLPNCQVTRQAIAGGFEYAGVCNTENQTGAKRSGRLTATEGGVRIHARTETGTMDISLEFERPCPPVMEAQDILATNGALARGDGP
jgi:hypothetical protein